MTLLLGARYAADVTHFSVRSRDAARMTLCLFEGEGETRLDMARDGEVFRRDVTGIKPGQRYGLRAAGDWMPERGLLFDDAKLLVDPYAVELDKAFVFDPRLAIRGVDTAALVPKALVCSSAYSVPRAPLLRPAGLIYELNVRAFSMLHPDIPPKERGTIAALKHESVIAHLKALRVSAVELMPITAWIDERHLAPLGLHNGWGYNAVVPMALDPRLAPGGVAELRATVDALHEAGIGVVLDLVFNHTGETDAEGPTLSLRGLDNRYYARAPDGALINDTGTGNTLDAAQPMVRQLMRDTLRHFVGACGVDGFRFDLAPIMARGPGFDPAAPIFEEIAADPLLKDHVLIAEPWDIGPGGYQLGNFPDNWLEWNDRYRDDVRRFWRGDPGVLGALATRMTGSSDIFHGTTRTVNFLASHDGFTLADLVSHCERHNDANGEGNRDGHGQNFSWNNGEEGPAVSAQVRERRDRDVRALLATLFASRGTIMLTAGDEFGRSQRGNNNAYAQDNEITWLDWENRDRPLEEFVAGLAALRFASPDLASTSSLQAAAWLDLDGNPMTEASWASGTGFTLRLPGGTVISVNRGAGKCTISSPERC